MTLSVETVIQGDGTGKAGCFDFAEFIKSQGGWWLGAEIKATQRQFKRAAGCPDHQGSVVGSIQQLERGLLDNNLDG